MRTAEDGLPSNLAGPGSTGRPGGGQLRRLPGEAAGRELAAREQRKRKALLKLATMSAVNTLAQFDWISCSGVPKAQILELSHLTFVERAENVVLLGPSTAAQ